MVLAHSRAGPRDFTTPGACCTALLLITLMPDSNAQEVYVSAQSLTGKTTIQHMLSRGQAVRCTGFKEEYAEVALDFHSMMLPCLSLAH